MASSLKDLERRREQAIERIAIERGQISMLASDVARPARGVLRLHRSVRKGWKVASGVAAVAVPVASFLLRSNPWVQRAGTLATVWQFFKGVKRKDSTDKPDG